MSDKLRVALGIISGRINAGCMASDDLCELGFNPYRCPGIDMIRERAEEIILEKLEEIK